MQKAFCTETVLNIIYGNTSVSKEKYGTVKKKKLF